MAISVADGSQIELDIQDERVWTFDWDSRLGAGVQLTDPGEFTVECYARPEESPVEFEITDESLLPGNRKVQFKMNPNNYGLYRIFHKITTSESIQQTLRRSFFALVRVK